MSFSARYPGQCLPCGEAIKVGEAITNHPEHGYIHEECTDVEPAESAADERTTVPRERPTMPPGKTARDRCDRCFLIHTAAQGSDCQ